MLLIASPKSASSALLKAMEKSFDVQGYMGSQWFNRPELLLHPRSPGTEKTAINHLTDFFEVTSFQKEVFSRTDVVFKHHLAPTKNNIHQLSALNFVVLLRPPEEICESYYRELVGANTAQSRPIFSDVESLTEMRDVFFRTGIGKELTWFDEEWRAIAKESSNILLLEHSQLMEATKARRLHSILYTIAEFWELEVIDEVDSLPKIKYAHDGVSRKFLRRLLSVKGLK